MTVLTPTLRQTGRRSAFWIIAAVALLLLAMGLVAVVGSATTTTPLSPVSAAPDGTKALVEVLRDEGVDVRITSSLADTTDEAAQPADTTIVLNDADALLTREQQVDVLRIADRLVLLDPGFEALDTFAPGVNSAGVPDDDPLVADCTLDAARNADTVSSGGVSYRPDENATGASAGAEFCLRSDSDSDSDSGDADEDSGAAADAWSLVQLDENGTEVSVLGATTALTNESITLQGNAAFALTLLGATDTLVWYEPSLADVANSGDPAALTPGWVTPVILLLVLTFVAAAVWRGRRFGPLIIENLPVTVRSSETMEGRARLYQKGSARLRAADALRLGTISRLATLGGLPSSSTVEEVVLSAASLTGAQPPAVRALLVDAVPDSDAALVRLSDDLLSLEAAARSAVTR